MKKIAIITINYNNAAGLQKTLQSIVEQVNCEYELIVIDGNSNDNSVEFIKQYGNEITYWVSEPDKGIYHAQNKGWQNAKAEYCLFLNSGDLLADKMVLSNVERELNDIDIVYGNIFVKNTQGKIESLVSPETLDVPHFMVSTLWHPSAFIKRSIFELYGGYNEDFKITGDYEFFIRAIIKHQVTTRHIKTFISIFNLEGLSNNNDYIKLQLIERKESWRLNFGGRIITVFENYTRLLRSREYKMSKIIGRVKNVFGY